MRDQMAMSEQDVNWAQKMDIFYADFARAEKEFDKLFTLRKEEYRTGYAEKVREFDILEAGRLSTREFEEAEAGRQFGEGKRR